MTVHDVSPIAPPVRPLPLLGRRLIDRIDGPALRWWLYSRISVFLLVGIAAWLINANLSTQLPVPFVQRDELRAARLHRGEAGAILTFAHHHTGGGVLRDDRRGILISCCHRLRSLRPGPGRRGSTAASAGPWCIRWQTR